MNPGSRQRWPFIGTVPANALAAFEYPEPRRWRLRRRGPRTELDAAYEFLKAAMPRGWKAVDPAFDRGAGEWLQAARLERRTQVARGSTPMEVADDLVRMIREPWDEDQGR